MNEEYAFVKEFQYPALAQKLAADIDHSLRIILTNLRKYDPTLRINPYFGIGRYPITYPVFLNWKNGDLGEHIANLIYNEYMVSPGSSQRASRINFTPTKTKSRQHDDVRLYDIIVEWNYKYS